MIGWRSIIKQYQANVGYDLKLASRTRIERVICHVATVKPIGGQEEVEDCALVITFER